MEMELEPRVKALAYTVKAMSRESPSQKAAHVLDTDLRTHWSTATNTKEWILLELQEPCLLSHIRIHNKSVLEWEIAVSLRYKPETFVKVRPRCEAPRRDMMYPTNYTPCRYVRISCLRGNPIAIFLIQLIGVSVTGLEPEFQPVVNHLLPHIISHKQESYDMHLQLLQDITNRLLVFIPQLEADLSSFRDDAEPNLRFFAMLAGPFYPILQIAIEREGARVSGNILDSEVSRNSQSSAFTVSSNFEPRRSQSTPPIVSSTSSSIMFRPDVIFALLRRAYKDSDLGTVCRVASRILLKLIGPPTVQQASSPSSEVTSVLDTTSKSEVSHAVASVDYSNLFGEEFRMQDDQWESSYVNILDIGAVEEGIFHVLYACVSQPMLCRKLAENASDLWSALPLVQALLPALRPSLGSSNHFDDDFSLWRQPFVHQALSQIVVSSCSSLYRPLLHACSGYLSSFSPSHAKAACVLIDLCCSVLAPWMDQVIAKVDLTMELLEDLLGTIQGARNSLVHARAALKYIVLALCGHMDDILGKYKEVKHRLIFLVEMLEPFLDPAIFSLKSTIAFGNVSFTFMEKQKHTCVIALNIIRTAVRKPAVLASLESEWRRGSVAPSVLLSILEPHMQLPPEIDLCKSTVSKTLEGESSTVSSLSSKLHPGESSSKSVGQYDSDGKIDAPVTAAKMDSFEDVSLFFGPPELRTMAFTNVSSIPSEKGSDSDHGVVKSDQEHVNNKTFINQFQNGLVLDACFSTEYFNVQADYSQLMNYRDCELRASEFRRLALDLHSQHEITLEGHDAAIDALLLAAECYVNPFFMMSFRANPKVLKPIDTSEAKNPKNHEVSELTRVSKKNDSDLETIVHLENQRDKIVLHILLEAAELDRNYQKNVSDRVSCPLYDEGVDQQVIKLSPVNIHSADAVTLVRQNEALLCNFLVQRLQREQHSLHEILLHSLVFLLHSATKLYCAPELVIDIILGSAEYLNGMLASLYCQFKESNLHLDPEKVHGVQRRWILLQRMVIASSGGDAGSDFAINNGLRYGNLISPADWMQKISSFSTSAFPLVRFLGWMAVSRNAKQYVKQRIFLASELSQLTSLLSIFADELAVVDNVIYRKHEDLRIEQSGVKQDSPIRKEIKLDQQHEDQSFRVIYPDLSKFFPNMKKQFEDFGEVILEAVGLQLRSLNSSVVPDILCWFSDSCSWPFLQKDSQYSSGHLKGYVARNAKAIVLYILESIVIEHMEAMAPEIPRVVQLLVSLCGAPYCDVSFLNSMLDLLKPIISYSLHKAYEEEKSSTDDSCLNFESLCFNELFSNIRKKNEIQDSSTEKIYSRALTIFILASVFPDLSFQCKRELLHSFALWADFTAFEPTTSFHDYLCAFQIVIDSCRVLLLQNLEAFGIVSIRFSQSSDSKDPAPCGNCSELHFCSGSCSSKVSEKHGSNCFDALILNKKYHNLSAEEIEEFSKDVEALMAKLNPTIELCWNLHHKLAKKLTVTSAECFMYSRFSYSLVQEVHNAKENDCKNPLPFVSIDQLRFHWRIGLEGLSEIILMHQESHCWEVASAMFDCLLGLPHSFGLDDVMSNICSAIKNFSCSAPKIAWRLQTDKWLSILFARGIHSLHESVVPLVDLFCAMLGHPEPEQRYIALQHLTNLVSQDGKGRTSILSSIFCNKLESPGFVCVPEPILSLLVSSTWDRVVVLASSDASLPLRTCAMALLVDYIPFASRNQLQSFLASVDKVLHGLGKLLNPTCEGPLTQLSIALIAGACLFAPVEDLSLIPQNVWKNIETLGLSQTEGRLGDLEKKACQVLCRLKNEGDGAKEVLKEVLSSKYSKQYDPDFVNTRESILQVLHNLSSIQSYFDIFSRKIDQEVLQLEEAEIELEILQKEQALQESPKYSTERHQIPCLSASVKHDNRLQQIKDHIHSLEKSKLREDIIARRQKKLLLRHDRQKYLEEAALREAELLQELDRERAAEVEKEIERQRLLEQERAKTRELHHSLDMEKERQTQRELQRELEQIESGLRLSRRDFSSTHSSRPRERYRERENGRSSNEGSARTSSSGSLQPEVCTTSSAIPTALSGPRPFSGQLPTILQSRDRTDECGSSYEDLDGNRDSGDTGSVGDPDTVSAFDGQTGGFGSAQRQGSRGSKPRQVIDRKERDGRREGKWERKHS